MRKIVTICWIATALIGITAAAALGYVGLPEKLNEIGDALAGFFSALAFVWLVGGYFLQHDELKETRREYEAMRINAETQAQLMRRDGCTKAVRLYITSLDAALDNFYHTANGFISEFLPDEPSITKYTAMGFILHTLNELGDQMAKDHPAHFKLLAMALNREVKRYAVSFANMQAFLGQEPDGPWVQSVLLENSVYSDIQALIDDNNERSQAAAEVFSISREIQ